MTIAQRIQKARKAKKLSVADLAKLLDVSRSTVHAWEHEGPGPSLSSMREIAAKLELDLMDLVEAA